MDNKGSEFIRFLNIIGLKEVRDICDRNDAEIVVADGKITEYRLKENK